MIALSSPGPDLESVASSGEIRKIEVAMQREITPFKDLVSLFKLIKIFKKERPDMVHSITPKAGLLSMIAAKITGVSIRVHTFTGLVFPTSKGLKRTILSLCDKITCSCASHIVAEGAGVKDDLQQNHITHKEITIIGNGNMRGIDLQYYNPEITADEGDKIRASIGAEKSSVVFIFVGRVVRDKGIEELINAFEKLIEENIDARLLIVGDTESKDPLPDEILQKINSNHLIFFNKKWIDDVRPYYSAADVLVFPSYREGFPNVVLEAGAMKLPSIVTDINGSREIIQQEENGVIIPPKDTESLFNQMKRLVLAKEQLTEMGEKARKNVSERFEQSFVRNCHKDFYRKILR